MTAAVDISDYFMSFEKNVVYNFRGIEILLEYLKGDTRTKTMSNGSVISNVMPAAYGYILNTNDIHGEEIDVYLADLPDMNAQVYVLDQVNPGDKTFDEHKVFLGFGSIDEVTHTYEQVFSDGSGPARIGDIVSFDFETFQMWLGYPGATLLPASKCPKDVCEDITVTEFNPIKLPPNPNKPEPKKIDEVGGVIIKINTDDCLKKIITKSNDNGGFDYTVYLYSALTFDWSDTVDALVRTLDQASDKDSAHIHLISPGGSVVLMGRIISAIGSTAACVYTYAEGEIASAATTIWAAGHVRFICEGATFMQHMSSQGAVGKSSYIRNKVEFCVAYVNDKFKRLIDIGLFTEAEVENMSNGEDIFISGDEAIVRVGTISGREVN